MAKTKKAADKSAEASAPTRAAAAAPVTQPVGLIEVDAPVIHASSFQASTTGTEMIVALFAPKLLVPVQGGMPIGATFRPTGVLSMSPQAAKDLSLVLAELVKKFEAEHGTLSTPYTQSSAAASNDKRKKSH